MHLIITHILIFILFSAGFIFLYKYNKNIRNEDSELHKHVINKHPRAYVYLKYSLPVIMFFFIFALVNNAFQLTLLFFK